MDADRLCDSSRSFLTSKSINVQSLRYIILTWALAVSFMLFLVYYIKAQFSNNIKVTTLIEGKITYLVIRNGDGLDVVNYTQDSLEYEFLHQPTKTQFNGHDTTVYYSETAKIRQPK